MNLRKELIDQSSHFAVAFLILGMINAIPHPLTFWTLGGLVAGGIWG